MARSSKLHSLSFTCLDRHLCVRVGGGKGGGYFCPNKPGHGKCAKDDLRQPKHRPTRRPALGSTDPCKHPSHDNPIVRPEQIWLLVISGGTFFCDMPMHVLEEAVVTTFLTIMQATH